MESEESKRYPKNSEPESSAAPPQNPPADEEFKSDPAHTFLTQKDEEEKPPPQQSATFNDLLFPGGKIAKLVKISNPRSKDLHLGEVLKRVGVNEPLPVILLSGAEGDQHSRVLVGIARAAYSTDAVIVSTGMKCGLESACSRKKIRLIGVCPESQVHYPTNNSTGERQGELTAGHSHLFVVGKKADGTRWEGVVNFKMELIERLRRGRGGPGSYVCKAVCVVIGDNSSHFWEVEKALKNNWAVIVLEESPVGREVAELLKGAPSKLPESLQSALKEGRVFVFPSEGTAEHLASAVHLHLTVTV